MPGSKPGRSAMANPKERVCKCGCNEKYIPTGCRQQFKEGHAPYQKTQSKERLCKCGCGQAIKPPARGRSYIEGHSKSEKQAAAAAEKRVGKRAAKAAAGPKGIAKDMAIGIATHALKSLAQAAKKAMVLDMIVAVGLISQEKVDDMIAFVTEHGFINENTTHNVGSMKAGKA